MVYGNRMSSASASVMLRGFAITCVCAATPQRVSENSEGCHTTKGVQVILWHSRSVSKHLTGVDEHTGVIEHPFLKFNTRGYTPQRVSENSKGCQTTPQGVEVIL